MDQHTYVAILAGGVGSRFWPGSREARPKQFLDMLGTGKSLLRLTFERFLPLCPAENIFIVTNEAYHDLVLEHLPELTTENVICEPSRNNTAPCIAYTAFKLAALDPQANFVVAPADHIILKQDVFVETLQKALAFTAENDAIVTVGLQPTRPDTGYGYIHFGESVNGDVRKVQRFTEKPNLQTAIEMIDTGEYLWNGGIFVWRAEYVKQAFETFAPSIYNLFQAGEGLYNTPDEAEFIANEYPKSESISVDYAILERADAVYTIPADLGWSDLGTWASLYEESEKDLNANALIGGKVLLSESDHNLIRMPHGKIAVIRGIQNFMVIDEGDVLLIYPKDKEQEIKQVTAQVKSAFGDTYL
jgi:mannose-1-phosphate guanylyltransferase